jgi:hypothetical protein
MCIIGVAAAPPRVAVLTLTGSRAPLHRPARTHLGVKYYYLIIGDAHIFEARFLAKELPVAGHIIFIIFNIFPKYLFNVAARLANYICFCNHGHR